MCSRSLFETACKWLGSLAYTESIPDVYSQYFVKDTEIINSVKVTNSLKLLVSFCISGSFCRKNCLMTSLLIWGSSRLEGKQFPILHNKTTITTCTTQFQNLSSHCVGGYQVVQSCTCKECSKNIQFLATFRVTIQPLAPVVNL